MCGRYILRRIAEAERYLELERLAWQFSASYNIAPTQEVPVARLGKDGVREGIMMRWGLIPYFAHGKPPSYSTINATVEKLESAPAWRGPWQRGRRCIMPADGFYEWHLEADGRKQPFVIEIADQPVFGFAALWDGSRREDGSIVRSCALVTLPANALMREIHNAGRNPYRMPAILRPEEHAAWLTGTPAQARALLQPYPREFRAEQRRVAHRARTAVRSGLAWLS